VVKCTIVGGMGNDPLGRCPLHEWRWTHPDTQNRWVSLTLRRTTRHAGSIGASTEGQRGVTA
jgi:hypothetical protein